MQHLSTHSSHGDNEDITDWFEDAACEVDWTTNLDGEVSSLDSVSTTFTDKLHERNTMLEQQCKEAEQKYQNLKVENQKLIIQLANESHRASKYHKKLQYIQDHHEVFNSLRKAYLNMRYNESTGRALKEITETACQTWKGILCSNCIESAKIKRIASGDSEIGHAVAVSKSDFQKLRDTVSSLEAMVERRETSWSFNSKKEEDYNAKIVELQGRVEFFNKLIMNKNVELDANHSDNQYLKGVIMKLVHRYREITKEFTSVDLPSLLNEHEKKMLGNLVENFDVKLTKKPHKRLMQEKKLGHSIGSPISSKPRRLTKNSKNKCKTAAARVRSKLSNNVFPFILPPLSGDASKKSKKTEQFGPKRSRLTV